MGRVIYCRVESPTQTPEDAAKQEASGEMWGAAPRWGGFPAVQAYTRRLQPGERGVEFETDVPPDPGSPPGQAHWRGPRPGVRLEDGYAKIKVRIVRNTQR